MFGRATIAPLYVPLRKAVGGGPYIGPQGGKYADPEHKISWKPSAPRPSLRAVVDVERILDPTKHAGVPFDARFGGRTGVYVVERVDGDAVHVRNHATGERQKVYRPAFDSEVYAHYARDIAVLTRRLVSVGKIARRRGNQVGADRAHRALQRLREAVGRVHRVFVHQPGDLPGIPADTSAYYQENGQFTASRRELHEQIMERFLSAAPPVEPGAGLPALLLVGGAGAGKTYMRERTDIGPSVLCDADAIRDLLPEYQRALNYGHDANGVQQTLDDAGGRVQREVGYILEQLRNRAFAQRKSVTLDQIGDSKSKMKQLLRTAQEAGYMTRLAWAYCSPEEAVARAESRAVVTGRRIPLSLARNAPARVRDVFFAVQGRADEAFILNTESADANVVWSRTGDGPEKVHDDNTYRQVQGLQGPALRKAHEEPGRDEHGGADRRPAGGPPQGDARVPQPAPGAHDPQVLRLAPLALPLRKGGPLFTGPKGGKYTDPEHKHPWHPGQGEAAKQGSLFDATEHRSARTPLRNLDADQIRGALCRLNLPLANPHAHLYGGLASGLQATQAGDKWVALTWVDHEKKGDGAQRFQRALEALERKGFVVNRTRFGKDADKVLVGAPERSSVGSGRKAEADRQMSLFKAIETGRPIRLAPIIVRIH